MVKRRDDKSAYVGAELRRQSLGNIEAAPCVARCEINLSPRGRALTDTRQACQLDGGLTFITCGTSHERKRDGICRLLQGISPE
ncbi:unnamed protein product, partial [Iphiclides podalirius]